MNLDLFGNTDSQVTAPRLKPTEVNFDWQRCLTELSYGSVVQGDMVQTGMQVITHYSSGASSLSDFLGYAKSQKPICVCVIDTSSKVRTHIANYVSSGFPVLVDSGAFRIFRKNLASDIDDVLSFQTVFDYYQDIINQCKTTDTLSLVMPDVVGEQSASLDLLQKYKNIINQYHRLGCNLVVPLQKGERSLSQHYQQCIDVLGFDTFTVGLPSNAKAVTQSEVIKFLVQAQPKSVHFLGMKETSTMHHAMGVCPNTDFSSDATQLRKHIGNGKLLTEMHRSLADEATHGLLHDGGQYFLPQEERTVSFLDETDVLGDVPGWLLEILNTALFKELCGFTQTDIKALKKVCQTFDNDACWALLEEDCYCAEHYVISAYHKYLSGFVSPATRVESISILARRGLI